MLRTDATPAAKGEDAMFGMIGSMIRSIRCGDAFSVWNRPELYCEKPLPIWSAAFADGAPIPRRYAGKGEGENLSPPLEWAKPPRKTTEVLLLMEDIDVPLPRPLIHAAALIFPRHASLAEGGWNGSSENILLLAGGYGGRTYAGPLPIPGHGPHRYRFLLFALDACLRGTQTAASIESVIGKAAGHVLARGRLTGTYERG